MTKAFVDPYLIPGTNTLKNKLGLTDPAELEKFERSFSAVRHAELSNSILKGDLNYDHLKKIHRDLFGDVYEWAGKSRTVNIAKRTSFAPAASVDMAATQVLNNLANDKHLEGMGKKLFLDRAAYHLGEINFVHPFREGNGRAQRAFMDQVAQRTGYSFNWGKVSRKDVIEAFIHSVGVDHSKLAVVLEKALLEPLIERQRAQRLDSLAANNTKAHQIITGIRDKLLTASNDKITSQSTREKFADAVTDRLLDQHDNGKIPSVPSLAESYLREKDTDGIER